MSPDREELTLFRELFEGYDKRLRPALRKEDNVTVTLGISVNQLIDIVSDLLELLDDRWRLYVYSTYASGAEQTDKTNSPN